VTLKPGVKYCDFCGMKVCLDAVPQPRARKCGGAAAVLRGVVLGSAAIGLLVFAGYRLRERKPPPPHRPPSALDGKQRATATCEAAIRQRARAPFRVIALRSTLVADDREGYVVSGSVELQSIAGEVRRSRYFCRVHPDERAGMLLDEAKIE
jgi:hypothetical protein